MSTQDLPLTGVRVIEMTHMVMGPTCGMVLAQLGAEVIKVEPPAGDKTRSLGGMGISFFPLFNRGKRSVVLDFAKAEDRETMHRLLASADVFLENFRDGIFVESICCEAINRFGRQRDDFARAQKFRCAADSFLKKLRRVC